MIETNSLVSVPRRFRTGILAAFVFVAGACAPLINREEGRPIRPVVGNDAGSTARGAIIRAFVGGTAGDVIGRHMDEQAKELEVAVPGAVVERVGEGIRVTFASGLLYGFDSDAVRPEAAHTLQGLAASLKRYPDTQLLIVAHTDAPGGTEYNEDLTSRRAYAALRYLVAQGIGPGRVHAIGRGEAEAVATNDTQAGRERNRRIEMAIFSSQTARTVAR
jgi:outer membrane protein OmpA-like peptidoglycan-associated protein